MSKFVISFVVAVFLMGGLSTAAKAEPMLSVLVRCAASIGCGFSTDGNGDVHGCSIKSQGGTGHCFYCNNQTKDCQQVGRSRGGKWRKLPGSVLADLSSAPRRDGAWWW
jgi:hypothetical protein